jgi:DNA polymerase-3 subunit delta
MSFENLERNLNQKTLPPLLLVEGDEEHLTLKAFKAIESRVPKDSECFTLYGDQVEIEEFLNSVNTLSFFSESKVFLIKSAQLMPADVFKEIVEIFKSDTEGLHLVLFFNKLDKRKKVFKALLSMSQHFELKPPYENQMNHWVLRESKEMGLSLNTQGIELIRHLVGDGLNEIHEALQRLKDQFGKKKLSNSEIQEAVTLKKRSDLFKICDLFGKADFTEASLEMDRALAEGESSVALTHLLLRHFDILTKLKKADRKLSKYDLAKEVGLPAFFIPNYQKQSALWKSEDLVLMQELIEELDIKSKSTGLKPATLNAALLVRATTIYGKKSHLMYEF